CEAAYTRRDFLHHHVRLQIRARKAARFLFYEHLEKSPGKLLPGDPSCNKPFSPLSLRSGNRRLLLRNGADVVGDICARSGLQIAVQRPSDADRTDGDGRSEGQPLDGHHAVIQYLEATKPCRNLPHHHVFLQLLFYAILYCSAALMRLLSL